MNARKNRDYQTEAVTNSIVRLHQAFTLAEALAVMTSFPIVANLHSPAPRLNSGSPSWKPSKQASQILIYPLEGHLGDLKEQFIPRLLYAGDTVVQKTI